MNSNLIQNLDQRFKHIKTLKEIIFWWKLSGNVPSNFFNVTTEEKAKKKLEKKKIKRHIHGMMLH